MDNKPASQQKGGMLLEALVGILIFSIGILAMLGMQAVGIRNTIDSKYRSEAAYLANEIVGQMWVDRSNITSYDDTGSGNARRTAWNTRVASLLPQDPAAPTTNAPTVPISARQATVTTRWNTPCEPTATQHVMIAQIHHHTCCSP